MKKDLEAWLELLFRRRYAFAYGVGSIMLSVTLLSFFCPPFFVSTAEIMLQQDRAQLLVSPNLEAGQLTQPAIANTPPDEQDLNSEAELLTSPYLIKRAVEGLKPPQGGHAAEIFDRLTEGLNIPTYLYTKLHGIPRPTAQQQWEHKLRRHLQCVVVKRSNMISIRFSSHSGSWSREFLSRLLDRYLEFRVTMSHDPQAEHFFYQQANVLKAKLSQSENDLRALKLQTGVIDLDAQEKALVEQLSAFRAQYRHNQSQLAGINQRIDYLNRQLTDYPQRVDAETKVVQNMALQALKPQVMQLEAERAELVSRYRPDSERIKSIDAKLEAANTVLHREDTREVQETSSTINPTWQSLSSELAEAKVNSNSVAASQIDLAKQIADYESQTSQLTKAGVEIERLQRQVDTDKEAYLSYVRKGEEARAADALNLNKIVNVSIAAQPTLPLEPIFPRMPLNLLAGVILALSGGIGAALWSELSDERIFSAAIISKVSDLRTVAVLRSTVDPD